MRIKNDIDVEQEQLLYLLNMFAQPSGEQPWLVREATQYHMDEFGDSIHSGSAYFARAAGSQGSARRISLDSARRLWQLLIADNHREEEISARMKDDPRSGGTHEAPTPEDS